MTAPFAPPVPRPVWFTLLGAVVVAIALPFVRREDALGGLALLAIAVVAAGLWGMLLWGIGRAIRRWWRPESEPD